MIIDSTGIEGFSKRLSDLIEKNENKAAKIADIIGMQKSAIYKLCDNNGKFGLTIPSSETLLKLSAYFEVNPFWLLFGINYEDNYSKESELTIVNENESLKKENEKLKMIYESCDRKIYDLYKDFENMKKTIQ